MAIVKFSSGGADEQGGDRMPSRPSSSFARTRRPPSARHIRRCGARLHLHRTAKANNADELAAALQCSPVNLALVAKLVSRDPLLQSLLHFLSGVMECNHATIALQIVSVGVEPLVRILGTFRRGRPSYPHSLERDYQ